MQNNLYSNFKPTTATRKIRDINRESERLKIIQGGTSASKTYSILALLITEASTYPNQEISVVSESVPHLRRGAMRDFLKIMMATGRFVDAHFNKSLLKYNFANGSYIEFFSVDQPDKLRGARRTTLFLNEANNISFEAYKQLSIRTSGTIWIDFNPTSKFWAHTELMKDEHNFLILTYKDNEALPESIIKDIESAKEKAKDSSYWQNWWNVYGLGQVGALEGVCIPEWTQIDTLPNEARLLCYGLDFGYSLDPTALIGLYKYNDSYIFDEIIYQKGLLNSDISDLLNNYQITEFIYADSAEPKSIDELKQRGHKVLPVSKGRDSVVYGIELINQNKILVTQRSTNLIDELTNYSWQKDKEGNYIKKPIDAFNHGVDAARYALMEQLKNKNRGQYFVY